MRIAILNYGVGNLASVRNALEFVRGHFGVPCEIEIQSHAHKIKHYDKVILPGVGAFGDAMACLRASGMDGAILEFAKSGKFMLGICLGMQLLFDKSAEFGSHAGLGLISGDVIGFSESIGKGADGGTLGSLESKSGVQILKIPHMGWNACKISESALKNSESRRFFDGLHKEFYLYFVHSFHARCADSEVLATCEYGVKFPAIVQNDNVFGIQPHPEKSQTSGLQLLKNFMQM